MPIKINATAKEVTVENWNVLSGEYGNTATVVLDESFNSCDVVIANFDCKDGVFESVVSSGGCEIPCFASAGVVNVGVYGYDQNGTTLVLRVSPTPTLERVEQGSYIQGGTPTPQPSSGTYQQLLDKIDKKTERMKITVTKSGNTFTADKTFNEILTAYQNGILPYVYLEYEILIPHIQTYNYMSLSCLAGNQFVFSNVMGGVNNSVTVMSVYISYENEVSFYLSNLS